MKFALIGIGNILQKDDGIALFATKYLEVNYTFSPELDIIHGGVEGMNLLNFFLEYEELLFLDTVCITDKAGTIYHIPTQELSSSSLTHKGAHEVGFLECLDMLELMDEKIPDSSVLGIVPDSLSLEVGLSESLLETFDTYVQSVLKVVKEKGYEFTLIGEPKSLENIMEIMISSQEL